MKKRTGDHLSYAANLSKVWGPPLSYGGLASTPAGFTFLLNTLAFIGHTENLDSTGLSLLHGLLRATGVL